MAPFLRGYRVPRKGLTYAQRSKLVKYRPKLVKGSSRESVLKLGAARVACWNHRPLPAFVIRKLTLSRDVQSSMCILLLSKKH